MNPNWITLAGVVAMLGALKLYEKLRSRCVIHLPGRWELKAEIPLWHYAHYSRWAAGNQPTVLAHVDDGQRKWSEYRPDLDYVLAGKLIEQTNTCAACGFIRHKWTKVTV